MRLLIITSCTGEKFVESERRLMQSDLSQGPDRVAERERELADLMRPAAELYSGEQHVRLMRGVRAYRELAPLNGDGPSLSLWILSAGYGLVPHDRQLAPYECTFATMRKKELRAWADQLNVPADIRRVLAQPYDLGLLLLGDSYLEACALDRAVALGGPTIALCGANTAKRMPHLENLRTVVVTNQEAKRFSCGLVGLKGELARRLLERLAAEPGIAARLPDPETDVLALLDASAVTAAQAVSPSPMETREDRSQPKPARVSARANPSVDRVIDIPQSWWQKPHRSKLRYFIPEWDDLVDPDYDFTTDTHSGGSGDWSNEVYAHQMYPEPNYDGILISKVVAEKSKKKKERINALGVHRFLRVPQNFPIIGDCGAFGYIMDEVPPYSTGEILDYYTRLGFNYGVSIDHLVVAATEQQKQFRYDLTIHNAAEFLREHRARGLPWTPIGAVQGWDPQTYAMAARQYVAMGYTYIALGGLVRTSTRDILRILAAVHAVVPETVEVHLFGLARLGALTDFARLGVTSVDSASFLRQAWMRNSQGYLLEHDRFAALRIPETGKSFRAKRMVQERGLDADRVLQMEQVAIRSVRALAQHQCSVDACLNALLEYDQYIGKKRKDMLPLYTRTLTERPWEQCDCDICQRDGVEVVIFRGNNRNRRRGFHNTYVFYRLLQRILAGERVPLLGADDEGTAEDVPQQLTLFAAEEALV